MTVFVIFYGVEYIARLKNGYNRKTSLNFDLNFCRCTSLKMYLSHPSL